MMERERFKAAATQAVFSVGAGGAARTESGGCAVCARVPNTTLPTAQPRAASARRVWIVAATIFMAVIPVSAVADELTVPLSFDCRVVLLDLSESEYDLPQDEYFVIRQTPFLTDNLPQLEACCPVEATCVEGLPPCRPPDQPCCPIEAHRLWIVCHVTR